MKLFMDKDFLLKNETAKRLYHDYAEKMPIIDYHCHINPKEIWEDRNYKTITEAWLEGDHYKWRAIRSNGTPEEYITGNTSDKDKFKAYAAVMDKCIGNPLYHWSHLELKRYFDYDGVLSAENADEVFGHCDNKLKTGSLSVRRLIEKSNVTHICTTDDPADSLEYHKLIHDDDSFKTQVLPAWRPDKALDITASGFSDYIDKLSDVSEIKIENYSDLLIALVKRLDFFDEMGCLASDHSLSCATFSPADDATVNSIFEVAFLGKELSQTEEDVYKTALMIFLGKEYAKRGWVMQLHIGPVRNTNSSMFESIGADAGFDCIGQSVDSRPLTEYLNELNKESLLPKTVLYSLNPNDNAVLDSVIGCFQNNETAGKIQHGSAWWFSDTISGMRDQLISLSSQSLLGNFIGMLTDSRSFLSYTRHEYFRRILCNLIGEWVENGEYPNNLGLLGKMVEDISYNNTARYFGFNNKN